MEDKHLVTGTVNHVHVIFFSSPHLSFPLLSSPHYYPFLLSSPVLSSHATVPFFLVQRAFFYPAFHLLTSLQLLLFYFSFSLSSPPLPPPLWPSQRQCINSSLTFKESDPREPMPFTYRVTPPLVRFWQQCVNVKDGGARFCAPTCNPSHVAVRYGARARGEDSARVCICAFLRPLA